MLNITLLDCTVLQRGWLSSNNILFTGDCTTAIVDTGYCAHAAQTCNLVRASLRDRQLDQILNTHLHSDHCGGNAALQSLYPNVTTLIPPGSAHNVASWDASALSYIPTGQDCPQFSYQAHLQPGQSIRLGSRAWDIYAAPGHDQHGVILFEPISRTLISADALWENGFGVVFQELSGDRAFNDVSATLDLIESLSPETVIPGHGAVFYDAHSALSRARSRLEMFTRQPTRHAMYGAKVLVKYKMLEWQSVPHSTLINWMLTTPYFSIVHRRYFNDYSFEDWSESVLDQLARAKAIDLEDRFIINRD